MVAFLQRLIHEQGDKVRYDSPYGPVYFFNHPDQVQVVLHGGNFVRTSLVSLVLGQGLLASEGAHWRAQRRLAQPLFHEACLPAFIPAIIDATQAMLRRWDETCHNGATLDVSSEMRRLTLEVIFGAFFSSLPEGDAGDWDAALTTLIEDLGAISSTQFNVPLSFSPTRHARFQEALQSIDRKVRRMIEVRRALEDKPRDLLTLLMQKKDGTTGQPLEDVQIRDEVVTMLIAGHETTAIALGWVWQALAENPAVEERMSAELEQVLQGRTPTANDLPGLRYTRMVLEETMRLYPPVWVTSRQTLVEEELAGCRIPAKTVVLISAYTTHRHPEFWEEPERFNPERFDPEKEQKRHRYAYLPFGGGRHVCLGQSFAILEGQIILARILPRWKIRPAHGHTAEIDPSITLRQRGGLWMTVEPRSPLIAP